MIVKVPCPWCRRRSHPYWALQEGQIQCVGCGKRFLFSGAIDPGPESPSNGRKRLPRTFPIHKVTEFASLAVGLAAFAMIWRPELAAIALPLAFLGLTLSIGLHLAALRKGGNFRLPLTGLALNLLALLLGGILVLAGAPDSQARPGQSTETPGPRGLPASLSVTDLCRLLQNQTVGPEARRLAADALGTHGSEAETVLPVLLETLLDPDVSVRVAVMQALGKLGPAGKIGYGVLVVLERFDPDPESPLHRAAVASRAQLGALTANDLPQLRAALRDRNQRVRSCAALSLCTFRDEVEPALPFLAEGLNSDDATLRLVIVESLHDLAPEFRRAVDLLGEVLRRDADAGLRQAAGIQLSRLGPKARSAVPALTEALQDSEPGVCLTAATALWAVTEQAERVLPTVNRIVTTPANTDLRRDALLLLSQMSRKARGTLDPGAEVPVLLPILDAKAGDTISCNLAIELLREMAARSPSKMAAHAGALNPKLAELLEHGDADLCKAAAQVLLALDHPARETTDALSRRLDREKDPTILLVLAQVHWAITAQADRVLPVLRGTLDNVELRGQAVSALGDMGPAASPAIADLLRHCKDPDARVRAAIALALGQIAPEAPEVLAALTRFKDDPDPPVRQAAAQVLTAIGK